MQLRFLLCLSDEVGDYAVRTRTRNEVQATSPAPVGGAASHMSPMTEGSEHQIEDLLFTHGRPDLTNAVVDASVECHIIAYDGSEELTDGARDKAYGESLRLDDSEISRNEHIADTSNHSCLVGSEDSEGDFGCVYTVEAASLACQGNRASQVAYLVFQILESIFVPYHTLHL